MNTIHQNKTILHAVLLPTDRNGIMGKCEHGKSMFANCGHCLWMEIGGEYPDERFGDRRRLAPIIRGGHLEKSS